MTWLVTSTRLKKFTLLEVRRSKNFPFYSMINASLSWTWIVEDGYQFLDCSTKFGRDYIITMIMGITWAVEKWQGYLPWNNMSC